MEPLTDHKRRISGVDSLWLHMDTPENLMVIEGVMTFDGPIDPARATHLISTRLPERYPVFKQIPVPSRNPLAGDNWVDYQDFNVDDHLVFAELPEPGNDEALKQYVGEQMSVPLNKEIPLWQIHFLSGYQGGTAMMARFHHSLADGTALARVLLELTDDVPEGDREEEERLARPGVENVGQVHQAGRITAGLQDLIGAHEGGLRQSVLQRADVVADQVSEVADQVTETATEKIPGILRDGYRRLRSVVNPDRVEDAISVVDSGPDIVNKLLLAGVPESPFTGAAGIRKTAVWSQQYDLQRIKDIGRAHGATINDVMIAALAGALRSHVLAAGGDPTDLSTMIPVNLRPLDQPLPQELGNKFALVMLVLPVSEESPIDRLVEAKARMDAIKTSPEAVLTFGMIEAIGSINQALGRKMIDFFSAKASGVTTNVPGPRDQRYFAGTPVRQILGWVPGAGIQTLGTCIFSYNGRITVGFKLDTDYVPDPEGLVREFDDELVALAEM